MKSKSEMKLVATVTKAFLATSLAALPFAVAVQPVDAAPFAQVVDSTVETTVGITHLRIDGGDPGGNTSANLPLEALNRFTQFSQNNFSYSSQGVGFADLATGMLGARAAISSSSGFALAGTVTRFVRATFGDTITPTASGVMHFDFTVTGTFTGHVTGSGARIFQRELAELFVGPDCDCSGPPPGSYDLPVTAGVPLTVGMELMAQAGLPSGDANLLNTATVSISGVPFTSESGVFLSATGATNTPAGPNVVVQLGLATVTFENVTQAGTTTVTTSPTGPPPPSGFSLGTPPTYFDVATTAVSAGFVDVCIDYTGIAFGNEASLRLLHFDGAVFADVTTSLNTVTNVICGRSDTLSPFVVVERVQSVAEMIVDLIESVARLTLAPSQEQRLVAALEAALLQPRNARLVCASLRGFIRLVQIGAGLGRLPAPRAALLIEDATAIRAALDC